MQKIILTAGLTAGLILALATTSIHAIAADAPAAAPTPVHAIAMHGAPKYPANFDHLDYTNPDAPKGGEIRRAYRGTFDTLNPFVLKGQAAAGMELTYQTLLAGADDEAFTRYGLIAESMQVPEDRSYVAFNLRSIAKFSDGTSVTADDVVFSFNILMKEGHPGYRSYYAHVKEAVAESKTRVKFTFDMAGNRELPLIIGEMPILSKAYWKGKDFSAATLQAPLGSGPYTVKSVDTGKRIIFERVKDWWAKDLPIMKGQYNFDTIVYDAYRDDTVLLQAFFAGEYDFRAENIAKAWNTEYDTAPPIKNGLIIKEEIPHDIPTGMQAFAFNTRKEIFADAKVREALQYALDFEWSNKQLAFGSYRRTGSYFSNSELASSGLPEGVELAILEKYRGKIPDAIFTTPFANPKTSGSGQDMRAHLGKAKKLLEEAGWKLGKSGLLEKEGKPFKFEILEDNQVFERWTNPMISNLKKLGIEAKLRLVDSAQYQNRMDNFDFDMTMMTFGQSLSPGNEQLGYWGSAKADVKGSRNVIGIKSPVVDELIKQIIAAPDRESLIAATRALDRVLLWNYYVIPQWHIDYHRVAYWNKFGKPAIAPKYSLGADTWWYDAAKAAKIADKIKPTAK